jgi:hypothetical protein
MVGMARTVAASLLVLLGLSGAPANEATPDEEMSVIEDAPFDYEPPTLTAQLHFDAPSSRLGFGALDLSAHPEDHELRVGVTLGAAVDEKRWESCPMLLVDIDGEHAKLATSYFGVPMEGGVYDAVSVELSIEHVRAMVAARSVTASLCGDELRLDAAERARLFDFVRRFEEMATYDGPPPPAPPRELDLEDEEPLADPPLPV